MLALNLGQDKPNGIVVGFTRYRNRSGSGLARALLARSHPCFRPFSRLFSCQQPTDTPTSLPVSSQCSYLDSIDISPASLGLCLYTNGGSARRSSRSVGEVRQAVVGRLPTIASHNINVRYLEGASRFQEYLAPSMVALTGNLKPDSLIPSLIIHTPQKTALSEDI